MSFQLKWVLRTVVTPAAVRRMSGLHRPVLKFSEEVQQAKLEGRPIVALESTIITHGMPYPHNLQTAVEVENIIRKKGVTPATIAILKGQLTVGLTEDDLRRLAQAKNVVKTSRRDMAYVVASELDGGTTVAGTLVAAQLADIPVFVTGGIAVNTYSPVARVLVRPSKVLQEVVRYAWRVLSTAVAVRCRVQLVASGGGVGGVGGAAIIVFRSLLPPRRPSSGGARFTMRLCSGVHREGESTLDVSADLPELGRSDTILVCSGAKSILDIGRTLEYLLIYSSIKASGPFAPYLGEQVKLVVSQVVTALMTLVVSRSRPAQEQRGRLKETEGVCVCSFGESEQFPAFYTRASGHRAPHRLADARGAARLLRASRALKLHSGILVAVPVPREYAMNDAKVESAIEEAMAEARRRGVAGKQLTPFLLEAVASATSGASLQTSILYYAAKMQVVRQLLKLSLYIALIKNNAAVGADIALEFNGTNDSRGPTAAGRAHGKGLLGNEFSRRFHTSARDRRGSFDCIDPSRRGAVVVVGGANVDRLYRVTEDRVQRGRVHLFARVPCKEPLRRAFGAGKLRGEPAAARPPPAAAVCPLSGNRGRGRPLLKLCLCAGAHYSFKSTPAPATGGGGARTHDRLISMDPCSCALHRENTVTVLQGNRTPTIPSRYKTMYRDVHGNICHGKLSNKSYFLFSSWRRGEVDGSQQRFAVLYRHNTALRVPCDLNGPHHISTRHDHRTPNVCRERTSPRSLWGRRGARGEGRYGGDTTAQNQLTATRSFVEDYFTFTSMRAMTTSVRRRGRARAAGAHSSNSERVCRRRSRRTRAPAAAARRMHCTDAVRSGGSASSGAGNERQRRPNNRSR
ncbi:Pseudouridine-5'-phosphate glycosidase [Eumeta japonica]|uniref:Pseudouridine-5'-phosphate glycosidase n=1 Tax=Eumeta variegata TaxID=151549 RepID=A0A4C1Y6P1_EUMVA|nr:Pseudouridine-5'-phosphate glycosidase [Eumeta japonica]